MCKGVLHRKKWAAKHEYEGGHCCARNQKKTGQKQKMGFGRGVGCRNDSSILVGQMKVNVKPVTRRAQRSTGSTIVRVGMKSDERFERPAESVSNKREL